jgi:cytoskeleton protein RodZ
MASLGQALREEREARNISLEEIASTTKIVRRYLEALEGDRLDLMPGGFFIKGIIRTYARAVGLDPDEVVDRYKSAGLLEPAEASRGASKGAAPASIPPELASDFSLPAPIETPVPPEEAKVGNERTEAKVLFEEAAPAPGGSRLTSRQTLAWTLRGLAALAVVGAALILWSPWHHRPASVDHGPSASQSRPPATPPAETPSAPAAALKSPGEASTGTGQQAAGTGASAAALGEPSGSKPEAAAPPAAEAPKGLTIEISFEAETWIEVYADGVLRISGLFPAGATARAQASEKLLIHTGNAGGFTFKLNGRQAKPLGGFGVLLTDVRITPENLKDFLEEPSRPRPAG